MREKVSFERMIQELDKMMDHDNTEIALTLLKDFNVLSELLHFSPEVLPVLGSELP